MDFQDALLRGNGLNCTYDSIIASPQSTLILWYRYIAPIRNDGDSETSDVEIEVVRKLEEGWAWRNC